MTLGRLDLMGGAQMYLIERVEDMEPFLMTVVSSGDLWNFVSSTGALTAPGMRSSACSDSLRASMMVSKAPSSGRMSAKLMTAGYFIIFSGVARCAARCCSG